MQLEHTYSFIPKYPSQVKWVGNESNYEHIKYYQILKLFALDSPHILLKSRKCWNMANFSSQMCYLSSISPC